jgi:hypothetical protein
MAAMPSLAALARRLAHATGADPALDAVIAAALDPDRPPGPAPDPALRPAPGYTASVDACLDLIARALPGWRWHVGHGANGVLPYAALSHADADADGDGRRVEAAGPTMPLALLRALVQAKSARD